MNTFTFNCKGRLLVIDRPVIMGIINTTPDSFFKQSRAQGEDRVLQAAGKMITDGASILDIGGMSTRPGADEVSAGEEQERILPAIEMIRKYFPGIFISIDTYRAPVAACAVAAGADLVNDISAGDFDEAMLATVAALHVPFIAMHTQGRPKEMQQDPRYTDVTDEVIRYFIGKERQFREAGIRDWILDPGFGFGKNIDHNYTLLKNLSAFRIFGKAVMAGISRKSMIGRLLHVKAEEALNGTTAVQMLALQNGADILRVHDVKEARELLEIFNFYQVI